MVAPGGCEGRHFGCHYVQSMLVVIPLSPPPSKCASYSPPQSYQGCMSQNSILFSSLCLLQLCMVSCIFFFYSTLANDMVACVMCDGVTFLTLVMIDPGAKLTKPL